MENFLINILQWDETIFWQIQEWFHPNSLVFIAEIISFLAGTGILWFVLSAIISVRQKSPRQLFIVIFSFCLTALLSEIILKNLICRPRAIDLPNKFFLSSQYSFPSTHTSLAFSTLPLLWKNFSKKKRFLLILFSLLIGLTRIYLGRHYPLDVLGGILLGSLTGGIIKRFFDKDIPR